MNQAFPNEATFMGEWNTSGVKSRICMETLKVYQLFDVWSLADICRKKHRSEWCRKEAQPEQL